MLRDMVRLDAPELDACHLQVDVRTPALRVGVHQGRNVSSDYLLLQHAAPFLHLLRRPAVTILLSGEGRFEENGRRSHVRPCDVVWSDQSMRGTEAYTGASSRWLVADWDPEIIGGAYRARGFEVERLSVRELERIDRAATALAGPDPAPAMRDVVDVLRAHGGRFTRLSDADLSATADDSEQRLQSAVAAQLSNLRAHPALEDLSSTLGWNQRRLNRRVTAIARDYRFPWARWRDALHHTRLLQAIRLLAAPGATTEIVARLTGFRAPSALCHAFANGGLPSPGVLARAARRDVLDDWTAFADASDRPVAAGER